MLKKQLGAWLMAGLAAPAWSAPAATCTATSTAQRTSLIELYTSEGCNSCPPADRWLAKRIEQSDVVALAFHVDYWDHLGWRDRFASPSYTARQHWETRLHGRNFVYTPEVVIDGREKRDWRSADAKPAATPAPVLRLAAQFDDKTANVDVAIDGAASPDVRLFVAVWQDGVVSKVAAGENGGVTLKHERVVRALSEPLTGRQAKATLPLPKDFDAKRGGVTAFAQNIVTGEVVQAVDRSVCPAI